MFRDDVNNIKNNIFNYLVGKEDCMCGLLVKKHDTNIQTHGDFSFPNTPKSWQKFLNHDLLQNFDGTLLQYINKDVTNLIETSNNWHIPLVSAVELKRRVILHIDRLKSIQICFPNATYNNNLILDRLNTDTKEINFQSGYKDVNCITYLRLKLLTNVVKNLYLIKLYPQKVKIVMSWNNRLQVEDTQIVFCGPVLNGTSGAMETNISSEEYIRKRQEEIMLIAQHKYGYRVSSDCKWKEFISHLGESAVAFDLLQAKSCSPVKMYLVSNGGTSKGAAFILYNCARLETIIKTFNEKVDDGIYPALPPFDNIDFSLLNDKDEWNLIFNYIMGLPNLLNNCVEFSETKCEFKPHLICSFLSSMVKTVSQYYRRVRILTEPRSHLLPTLFARIHFIIILNSTLKICLQILNIKSVSQMYILFFYIVPITIIYCIFSFLQKGYHSIFLNVMLEYFTE